MLDTILQLELLLLLQIVDLTMALERNDFYRSLEGAIVTELISYIFYEIFLHREPCKVRFKLYSSTLTL